MSPPRSPLLALAALLGLSGCQNSCQQLCSTMKDYAEECGLTVSDDEYDTCVSGYGEATDDQLATCDAHNDADSLREWWSCDDLKDMYQDGSN
jgi:hypothetical protein